MLRFLTAGESHGPELAVVIEGLPAGLPIDVEAIDNDLRRRQGGYGRGARSTKIERDHAEAVSGLADGRSTGAPLAMRIVNRDFANQPERPAPLTAPRPGHADLVGRIKYGLEDFRHVRERASARETAARVAAGAVAKQLVEPFDVSIGSFVVEVGGVRAEIPGLDELDEDALERLAGSAEEDQMRTPDPGASERMRSAVDEARQNGETLGGLFCVFATGVPAGLGSYAHWDRKLDGRLAQALCSIPAVKAAEIGPALDVARRPGTEAQDPIEWRNGEIGRASNRAGGLEAGVTNGQPIVLRAAMKPLSSVRAEIGSVDFETGEVTNPPHVRSDVTAVPAAAVVGEAMVAWVLADAICERFGQDRLDGMLAASRAVDGTGRPGRGPASGT
ncbi:MAG TPA: chorismate synthase [Actinomycetota bacterium]|nr:chorismate synthase [Actinomycetota bacterium]